MRKIAAVIIALALLVSTLNAACSVTGDNINFGTYDPTSSTALNGTGNVNVHCTGLALLLTYRVYLSTGGSGNYSTREMAKDATYTLDYNLYTDSARTEIWGDATQYYNGDSVLLSLLTPYDQDYTVYGEVDALQNRPPGTYTDTITATLVRVGVGTLDTDSFTVTTTILSGCSVSAENMDFGTYDPASGTDATAASDIDVKCTLGTDYNVSLDTGIGVGASYTGRLMTGQSDSNVTLTYNLYTSSARTTVWGDGSGATAIVSGTGDGMLDSVTADTHPVYGKIPALQNVVPQTYKDTITVTVTY